MGIGLANLGLAAFQLGRYSQALASFREGLAAAREIEFKELMTSCVHGVGTALAVLGESERGACLIGSAEAVREELALNLDEIHQEVHGKAIAALRERLGERLNALLAEGEALALDEAVELALAESPIATT